MGKEPLSKSIFRGRAPVCPAGAKQERMLNRNAVTEKLVLIVDDEANVRQIIQQTLETFGYRAIVAAGGDEAALISRADIRKSTS